MSYENISFESILVVAGGIFLFGAFVGGKITTYFYILSP